MARTPRGCRAEVQASPNATPPPPGYSLQPPGHTGAAGEAAAGHTGWSPGRQPGPAPLFLALPCSLSHTHSVPEPGTQSPGLSWVVRLVSKAKCDRPACLCLSGMCGAQRCPDCGPAPPKRRVPATTPASSILYFGASVCPHPGSKLYPRRSVTVPATDSPSSWVLHLPLSMCLFTPVSDMGDRACLRPGVSGPTAGSPRWPA